MSLLLNSKQEGFKHARATDTAVSEDDECGAPESKRLRSSSTASCQLPTPTTPSRPSTPRPKPYVCTQCSKAFTRPCRLEEHERTHTGQRPYKCSYPGCTKSYMRETHLASHSNRHLPPKERKHKCEECGRGFDSSHHLKRHLVVHSKDKAHKCDWEGCGKTFAKRTQLHIHICNSHTKEKPHECTECKARFDYPSQLKRHKLKHSNTLEYFCGVQECTESFTKWSELQEHKKQAHGNITRVFTCNICGAEFKRKSLLYTHISRHNPDRQVFLCLEENCGRFYLDANSLRMHETTVHRPEGEAKRYVCDVEGCGKQYAYAHTLRRHMGTAHSKKKTLVKEKQQKVKENKEQSPVERQASLLELVSGMAYDDPKISGRNLPCTFPGCSYRFKRQIALDSHLYNVHGQQQDQIMKE